MAEPRSVPAGTEVTREGERGVEFFVVVDGPRSRPSTATRSGASGRRLLRGDGTDRRWGARRYGDGAHPRWVLVLGRHEFNEMLEIAMPSVAPKLLTVVGAVCGRWRTARGRGVDARPLPPRANASGATRDCTQGAWTRRGRPGRAWGPRRWTCPGTRGANTGEQRRWYSPTIIGGQVCWWAMTTPVQARGEDLVRVYGHALRRGAADEAGRRAARPPSGTCRWQARALYVLVSRSRCASSRSVCTSTRRI